MLVKYIDNHIEEEILLKYTKLKIEIYDMINEIKLLPPNKDLLFPLMKALELRRTKRKWKVGTISKQDLSNLLWSACGITRNETKNSKSKRTVPSARNSQVIKVYVALESGLFLYDEKNHSLLQTLTKDIRKHISNQKMMHNTPIGLIYVSDYSKLNMYLAKDDNRKWFISGTETGFISQNVYLYCASVNLSTAIIGLVDRNKLHTIMQLNENEKVVFTQAVGYSVND